MKLRAILAMVLAVGCGGSEDPPVEEPVEEMTRLEEQRVCERFTLTLESWGGDCLGTCYSRVHLTSGGVGYVAQAQSKGRPETKRLLVTTPEELEAVKGVLAEALTQKWEQSYGCLNCLGDGQSVLQYTCDGNQYLETALATRSHPEFLKPLSSQLWGLASTHVP
jgi:hypothetical protein